MSQKGFVPCPYCGEPIKTGAKSCPHCGSDEQTGWSDGTYLDGIDLGDDFDYDDMAAREFPSKKQRVQWWKSWKSIIAFVMVLLFLYIIIRAF